MPNRLSFLKGFSSSHPTGPDEPWFHAFSAQVECKNRGADRDVRYVLVRAVAGGPTPLRATIGFSEQISGTDLIYDVTGEFLQGKARPFECDLTLQRQRLYAVLPFQLESISLAAVERVQRGEHVQVKVEFLQGTGARIAGTLPFHLELFRPDGSRQHEAWQATDRAGGYSATLPLPRDATPGRWSLVVRSQLNGQEARQRFEVTAD